MKPIIIAIAGGSGSGKTTIAKEIAKRFNAKILNIDDYYLDQSKVPLKKRDDLNYDHPDSIEWRLLENHVKLLSEGKGVERPIYNFGSHTREKRTNPLKPDKYIIIEGILALHDLALNDLYDYRIFVDAPERIRFSRRLARDVKERHATPDLTKRMWKNFVKPMYDRYVEPSKRYADAIIKNPDGALLPEKVLEEIKAISE